MPRNPPSREVAGKNLEDPTEADDGEPRRTPRPPSRRRWPPEGSLWSGHSDHRRAVMSATVAADVVHPVAQSRTRGPQRQGQVAAGPDTGSTRVVTRRPRRGGQTVSVHATNEIRPGNDNPTTPSQPLNTQSLERQDRSRGATDNTQPPCCPERLHAPTQSAAHPGISRYSHPPPPSEWTALVLNVCARPPQPAAAGGWRRSVERLTLSPNLRAP